MNKEIKMIVLQPELEKRDKNKLKELDNSSVSSDLKSSSGSDDKLKRDISNNFSISNIEELPKYEK